MRTSYSQILISVYSKALTQQVFKYLKFEIKSLNLYVRSLMHNVSENGQTQFKNLVANVARFFKCVWPFWDVMY